MSLFDKLGSVMGGGGSGEGQSPALMTGLLEMFDKGSGEGLNGLVRAFQGSGLADVVSSWISTGPNLPVSADQIRSALGSDGVRQLAAKVGTSPESLSATLAEILPGAVDKLTPDGKIPEGGVLEQALGMLKNRLS